MVGTASAQEVLFICTAQLPCPGFPLGSVQAGIDQNGWRHFKLTLTQNVTLFSFVGTPPPQQAIVNVIFTQDATGGRTVTFAANITSPCAIATAANATTLCQFEYDGIAGVFIGVVSGGTPGGSSTQLQFNNGGAFGGLANVASGSELVSNGAAASPIFQKKQAIDVRDFGVDCSDTNDSTTALQNAINTAGNFGKIVFPANCKVKVSGTPAVFLHNVQGLEIEMLGRQGNSCDQASSSGLDYTQAYASGNKVISILDSQRLRIKNLVIYVNGGADNGILIDQDLSTPPITTDNIFEGLCIFNNTATRNSAFIGINAGPTSVNNVESQRFRDIFVECSTSAPTSATSNGVGIQLPGSSNGVNEEVTFLGSGNCSVTLGSGGGQENLFSRLLDSTGNANTNVIVPGLNGGLIFSRFENSNIAVQQSNNTPFGPTLIMGNDFTNAGTVMDCNNNGCGQFTTIMNNEKDTTPSNWFNFHGVRANSGLFAINNRNFSYNPVEWNLGSIVFPDLSLSASQVLTTMTTSFRLTPRLNDSDFNANIGSPYIDFQSHSGSGNQVDDYYIEAMQSGGFAASGSSTLVFGHPVSNGVTPWFSFAGTMSGVPTAGIINPTAPVVGNLCSGGTSTWSYETVAHDGTGHTAAGPAGSTTTGCLNLASGLNKIQIPMIAGCTFFDVYRTVVPGGGTPSTTGKIGTVTCYNVGIANFAGDQISSQLTLADTGLAGDSSSPPSTNTTGLWQFGVGIQATGTAATLAGTGACATRSGQLGGAWAGQVTCTGATAASTLTITPGTTAANGWSCWANDVTHTLAGSQSATSTTAPVMSFTSVTASDVLTFGCVAY